VSSLIEIIVNEVAEEINKRKKVRNHYKLTLKMCTTQ